MKAAESLQEMETPHMYGCPVQSDLRDWDWACAWDCDREPPPKPPPTAADTKIRPSVQEYLDKHN